MEKLKRSEQPLLSLIEDTRPEAMDAEYVESLNNRAAISIYAHGELEDALGHDCLCVRKYYSKIAEAFKNGTELPVRVLDLRTPLTVIYYCTMFAWTADYVGTERNVALVCRNGDEASIREAREKMKDREFLI